MLIFFFFFFNDTATTEIYTPSLHDALPISVILQQGEKNVETRDHMTVLMTPIVDDDVRAPDLGNDSLEERAIILARSEEHTSELQSQSNLVCRLLLEKKKTFYNTITPTRPP